MPLAVVGLSHRTAPVEVRERFAFGRSEAPGLLAEMVDSGTADEAVLLSTCNRTELYLSLGDPARGERAVRSLLERRIDASAAVASRHLYVRRDRTAVEHLYRVTAGLESMVLGEPQIQGQVREAYQLALGSHGGRGPVVGTTLNRLFQTALGVGGRVRSETDLGLGAASISSAAVELAKKIFGSLAGRRAMILGAGEMSEVTLECLRAEGVRSSIVTNRTYERAVELAAKWGGEAVRFDDFASALKGVDIVICSTSAPHPVITRDRFRAALPQGAVRPLCIIDIAIPRDVDPRVADEPNVFLYNIDDLQQIVTANLERRTGEIPRAETIVSSGVEEFWSWYSSLVVVPTIRELRERSEALRRQEVERVLQRLSHLSAEDQGAIDALTKALLNKLLHSPTVRLREAAGNGRGTTALDTVRYLFELDGAPAEERRPDAADVEP
jgi:glutamyl-tRNA reductase